MNDCKDIYHICQSCNAVVGIAEKNIKFKWFIFILKENFHERWVISPDLIGEEKTWLSVPNSPNNLLAF